MNAFRIHDQDPKEIEDKKTQFSRHTKCQRERERERKRFRQPRENMFSSLNHSMFRFVLNSIYMLITCQHFIILFPITDKCAPFEYVYLCPQKQPYHHLKLIRTTCAKLMCIKYSVSSISCIGQNFDYIFRYMSYTNGIWDCFN